jgi:hypothetical protein
VHVALQTQDSLVVQVGRRTGDVYLNAAGDCTIDETEHLSGSTGTIDLYNVTGSGGVLSPMLTGRKGGQQTRLLMRTN